MRRSSTGKAKSTEARGRDEPRPHRGHGRDQGAARQVSSARAADRRRRDLQRSKRETWRPTDDARQALRAAASRLYPAGVLGLAGVLCGLKLPISLFPNSAKPEINVNLELRRHDLGGVHLSVRRRLRSGAARDPGEDPARRDARVVLLAGRRHLHREVRLGQRPGRSPQGGPERRQRLDLALPGRRPRHGRGLDQQRQLGFFAASFYSDRRSLDATYRAARRRAEVAARPRRGHRPAGAVEPASKESRPAQAGGHGGNLQLVPRDVEKAITGSGREPAGRLRDGRHGPAPGRDAALRQASRGPRRDTEFVTPSRPGRPPYRTSPRSISGRRLADPASSRRAAPLRDPVGVAAPGRQHQAHGRGPPRRHRRGEGHAAPGHPTTGRRGRPSQFIRSAIGERSCTRSASGPAVPFSVLFVFIGSLRNIVHGGDRDPARASCWPSS